MRRTIFEFLTAPATAWIWLVGEIVRIEVQNEWIIDPDEEKEPPA